MPRPILLGAVAAAIHLATLCDVIAQTPPAPAAPPPGAEPGSPVPSAKPVLTAVPPGTAVPTTWKDRLVVDVLVDSYYMYNFTGHDSTTAAGGVRQFDSNSNSFTLSYAKLGLGVTPEPVGLRFDVGYGTIGQVINSAIPAEARAQGGASTPRLSVSPLLVQQAFASVVLPIPHARLTVDFGKFVSSASAEVIEANRDWLYSRSILFSNSPFVHNGLRLTAKLSNALSVQASVVNGWNGTGYLPDLTRNKTFGVSISYRAPTKTTIVGNSYFGYDEGTGTPTAPTLSGFRSFCELIFTQEIGTHLALYVDTEYINDSNTNNKAGGFDNALGVAVAGRYLALTHLTLAARGELARNGSTRVAEGTLMLGVPVESRFELRIEGRADLANRAIFNPTTAGVNTDKYQVTGLVAFLAWL